MLTRVLNRHSNNRTASSSIGLWRLRAIMPTYMRALVAGMLPDPVALQLTAYLENAGIDRKTARAFPLPSDGSGFIRLNLKGRERYGIVDPDDAEKLLDEISNGLQTFVEPSGETMIASFLRSSELDVHGPKTSSLPDLVVKWSPKSQAGLRRVTSPRFGEIVRDGVGSGRSGNHGDGAWICMVPGSSQRVAADVAPARAIDIATTVCDLMEAPRQDLPGRPLLTRELPETHLIVPHKNERVNLSLAHGWLR